MGLDPRAMLDDDAYILFAALGDLVVSGPRGRGLGVIGRLSDGNNRHGGEIKIFGATRVASPGQ